MSVSQDSQKSVPRTPVDLQKLKLEKLMKNVDKPVHIAEPARPRHFPAPPEFVRTVMGSSAGAGSGEFHVYRHIRRREYSRVKHIAQQAEKEDLDQEFERRVEQNKTQEEQRTAKKRAKRLRKKAKQAEKRAKKTTSGGDDRTNIETSESEDEEAVSPAAVDQLQERPSRRQVNIGSEQRQQQQEDRQEGSATEQRDSEHSADTR